MADARGRNRVSIEVSEELVDRLYRLIPWGWKSPLIVTLLEQLMDAIETEGLVVAALIIDKKLKLFGKD